MNFLDHEDLGNHLAVMFTSRETPCIDYICYLKIKFYQIISTFNQTHFTAVKVVEVARTGVLSIYFD